MRCLRTAAWPALSLSLLCLTACSAQAEEPKLLDTERSSYGKLLDLEKSGFDLLLIDPAAALNKPTEANYDLPLPSSRRIWGWNRLTSDRAEPQLFAPDNAQPLPGIEAAGRPLPRVLSEAYPLQPYSLDSRDLRPGAPAPSPVNRLGVLFDSQIRPAVAEEPAVDSPSGDGVEIEIELTGDVKSDDEDRPELQQNEAAKVILELMETLGRSVLDGTVFQKPSKADQKWLKELDAAQVSPREALIQYIRVLEAQQQKQDLCRNECEFQCAKHDAYGHQCEQECADYGQHYCPRLTSDYCPGTCTGRLMFGVGVNSNACLAGQAACESKCACGDKCPCHAAALARSTCPAETTEEVEDVLITASLEPRPGDDEEGEKAEAVHSLRSTSEMLDHMAGALERKDLYQRADQLRELAQQLRQDARRTKNGNSGCPYAQCLPAGPPLPVTWDLPMAGPQYHPVLPIPSSMPIVQPYPPMVATPYTPPSPVTAPPVLPPVPPTYEQPSREKDLEREVHILRTELRKLHQALSDRSEDSRR